MSNRQSQATEGKTPPASAGEILRGLRRLLRIPSASVAAVILLVLILAAIFAPYLTAFGYEEINAGNSYSPPSRENLLGTDKFGRDVLTRIIYGGRISLRIGIVATLVGGSIGLILGLIAGYVGGWVDDVIMRIIDIILAFPGILLAMVIVAILGPGIFNLMLAVGISAVPRFARIVRGSTLSVRENEYVTAARALGAPNYRIMLRHILPNIAAPIIIYGTLNVATAILAGAALNFLGLGAQPPVPDWGLMLSDGRDTISRAWWVSMFPGLAIMITTLCINFLGDGLREVLDPHIAGDRG